jgi:hypothetical protein
MPNTYQDYTAPRENYSFDFPYLDVSHVKVFVDNVEKTQGTHFTVSTSPLRVVFTAGNTPANGAKVRIRRVTYRDAALVDFANGSTILESDLDTAVRQTLYINQETSELNDTALQIGAGSSDFYAQGKKITDVAAPTNANDATNKSYVDTADALKVAKAGDTMSGNLAMGGNRVTGLADPASNQDAATRSFVNAQVNNAVKFGSTTPPDVYSFTGDGSTTFFNLVGENEGSLTTASAWLVSLNGVVQRPTTDYTISVVSGQVRVTFTAAPPNGVVVVVSCLGFKVPVGAAQLDAGSITEDKIASLAVTAGKLANTLDFTGKTVTNINKTAVGLGNVQNLDQTNASNITSGTLSSNRFPLMANESPFLFTPGVYGSCQASVCEIPRISVDDKGRVNSIQAVPWVGKRLINMAVITPSLSIVHGLTNNVLTETYVDILLQSSATPPTTRSYTPLAQNSLIRFTVNFSVGYVGGSAIGNYKWQFQGNEYKKWSSQTTDESMCAQFVYSNGGNTQLVPITYALMARSYNASNRVKVHYVYYWEGAVSNQYVQPQIIIEEYA